MKIASDSAPPIDSVSGDSDTRLSCCDSFDCDAVCQKSGQPLHVLSRLPFHSSPRSSSQPWMWVQGLTSVHFIVWYQVVEKPVWKGLHPLPDQVVTNGEEPMQH